MALFDADLPQKQSRGPQFARTKFVLGKTTVRDLFLFEVLGQCFGFRCVDTELQQLVRANWERLKSPTSSPDYIFTASRGQHQSISLSMPSGEHCTLHDSCVFLYQLEHEVIIELEKRRADLYFLHAAVVELDGQACLLVAESGSGKSTTTWALLHHGFGYLSDELAPIEVDTLLVHAYPHALCLKQPPPLPYRLPSETIVTRHSLHVPVGCLPQMASLVPHPISATLFLKYNPTASVPTIRSIGSGEASARLYANALNQLAHPNAGLAAAKRIALNIPGFLLESTDLKATCDLIRSTLKAVASEREPSSGRRSEAKH